MEWLLPLHSLLSCAHNFPATLISAYGAWQLCSVRGIRTAPASSYPMATYDERSFIVSGSVNCLMLWHGSQWNYEEQQNMILGFAVWKQDMPILVIACYLICHYSGTGIMWKLWFLINKLGSRFLCVCVKYTEWISVHLQDLVRLTKLTILCLAI